MPASRARPSWRMRFGANVVDGGEVEFRVWAPKLTGLALRILDEHPRTLAMTRNADAEFLVKVSDVVEGADYAFLLEGERQRPDPVSRWQPQGVHGPSRVVDPCAFPWSDASWKGLPLETLVIYELHTGTFTPEGTFEAIISRLPYLRELGVNALELMPVAEFPGGSNWGYDGASLYAPHTTYGGPHGLKKLIDACHGWGLAVVLDVVYNHLGPEGSYLPDFAPCFTNSYRTPWGAALNFDGPESDGVRRFFIDNALYWLTEYHIDAVRLDAIHGIYDFSAHHILDELTEAFHREARHLGRQAWVIAESDLNDVRIINPRSAGGFALDAQWHDDFHHSLYTLLTGEQQGYLMDFGSVSDLAKSVHQGFIYDGRYSRYRRRRHGSSSEGRPGKQFVVCIQNHDQVANTGRGERLASLVSLDQQKLAAALLLCSPFLPLLFMGQEYGETAFFLFFTSYGDPKLVTAVRKGRQREYAAYYGGTDFPDPQAETTYQRCKLDWSKLGLSPHAELLRLYRDLLALRRQHACLNNCRKDLVRADFDDEAKWLVTHRTDPSGSSAIVVCNFSAQANSVPIECGGYGWRLALWTGDSGYGASPSSPPPRDLAADVGESVLVTLAQFSAALYLRSQETELDQVSCG